MTTQIMVKMVLDAWHSKIKEANDILDQLTDEQLQNEVAPDRNRGIYLLGHLTATHDGMLPVLSFGERLYPQLDEIFIDNPDKSITPIPSANELRSYWKNINSILADHFNKLPVAAWFEKHNSVSAEDFIKQPHRNKLNVIIPRTNHLSYHTGQLVFLKKQEKISPILRELIAVPGVNSLNA
ncbi:MAG TPA: DinB family protein [Chitinophagales bacterium]|nr:DinB family protein [Chitinophagales bacterium]